METKQKVDLAVAVEISDSHNHGKIAARHAKCALFTEQKNAFAHQVIQAIAIKIRNPDKRGIEARDADPILRALLYGSAWVQAGRCSLD